MRAHAAGAAQRNSNANHSNRRCSIDRPRPSRKCTISGRGAVKLAGDDDARRPNVDSGEP